MLPVVADDSTHTGILTRNHHLQVVVVFLRIIYGIGIEVGKHSANTSFDSIGYIQSVNIHHIELAEDRMEDIKIF